MADVAFGVGCSRCGGLLAGSLGVADVAFGVGCLRRGGLLAGSLGVADVGLGVVSAGCGGFLAGSLGVADVGLGVVSSRGGGGPLDRCLGGGGLAADPVALSVGGLFRYCLRRRGSLR